MFSGLVQSVGTLESAAATPAGRELRLFSDFADLEDGESISVSGVCLTVRDHRSGAFTVAAGSQTVERTNVGRWPPGQRVNLERALRVGDRVGGHLVQGHVDGVAEIVAVSDTGDVVLFDLRIPAAVADLLVPLGSVALDGVSLTVNAVPAPRIMQVAVIDYTRRHTTLGELQVGDLVHVEADIVAKYVRQLAEPYMAAAAKRT